MFLRGELDWSRVFPQYLTAAEKGRLRDALRQFKEGRRSDKFTYNEFYKVERINYFMQGDVLLELRYPLWSEGQYQKRYTDAIIISNTCDIAQENDRSVSPKECCLAPIINFEDFSQRVYSVLSQEKAESYISAIISQEKTHLFYLPRTPKNNKHYVALLDNVFWITTNELNNLIPTINEDRIASLNHYGFYLFLTKLAYHFCRFPEENDRPGE